MTAWIARPVLQASMGSEPAEDSGPIRRALLAEDNVVNQRLLLRLLEREGFEVDVAANGREAVEMFSAFGYDVVLMDCHMPEMDGLAAVAEMRRYDAGAGRHTPVVAITASAGYGDRERCLAAGMDDYIAKPIEVENLRSVLGTHLGRPALSRE